MSREVRAGEIIAMDEAKAGAVVKKIRLPVISPRAELAEIIGSTGRSRNSQGHKAKQSYAQVYANGLNHS